MKAKIYLREGVTFDSMMNVEGIEVEPITAEEMMRSLREAQNLGQEDEVTSSKNDSDEPPF